jgi:hypothetical protein
VILNADIFSDHFIAYCIQNMPSVWATAALIVIGAAFVHITVRNVQRNLAAVNDLHSTILTGGDKVEIDQQQDAREKVVLFCSAVSIVVNTASTNATFYSAMTTDEGLICSKWSL